MSETVAFSNSYMCYVENQPYKYPSIDVETVLENHTVDSTYTDTGYHIIPNFLWRHVIIPRQWAELVMGAESYCIKSIEGIAYNPIPITTTLAIQRVNQFSAFNNCTYAMTYTDDKYETQWYKWLELPRYKQLHLAHKEGVIWTGTQAETGAGGAVDYVPYRYSWPFYKWKRPQTRTVIDNVWSQGKIGQAGVFDNDTRSGQEVEHVRAYPGGIFWDPLNCPSEIGELRAGKNSISFRWEPTGSDADKYFNLDCIASFAEWTADGPYCGVGRPGTWKQTGAMDPDTACTFGLAQKTVYGSSGTAVPDYWDYTIPNYYNMPIVPTHWFWNEIGSSIIDSGCQGDVANNGNNFTQFFEWRKSNKYYPGTEWEAAEHPPCQWFMKGIPLYDAQNQLIRTTTQISFQIKITLGIKKRRSAYFAATHGPWSGDQLYYHTNQRGIFQPNVIRYRTGGRRRTWQNLNAQLKIGSGQQNVNFTNLKKHPRIDPYWWPVEQSQQSNLWYESRHAPAGMPDGTVGTQGRREEYKHSNIKVTYTRATDTTEIHMDDDDEDDSVNT